MMRGALGLLLRCCYAASQLMHLKLEAQKLAEEGQHQVLDADAETLRRPLDMRGRGRRAIEPDLEVERHALAAPMQRVEDMLDVGGAQPVPWRVERSPACRHPTGADSRR